MPGMILFWAPTLLFIVKLVAGDTSFIGYLSQDVDVSNSKFYRVSNFKTHKQNGIRGDEKRGQYVFMESGLFLVSCSLILKSSSDDVVNLLVVINDDSPSTVLLQSLSHVHAGTTMLTVHGLIKANADDTLQIDVSTQKSTKKSVKRDSRLHITRLSMHNTRQYFSVSLLKDTFLQEPILVWSDFQTIGSFSTTNLLNFNGGYFVAKDPGVYLLLGNIVFENVYPKKLCATTVYIKAFDGTVLAKSSFTPQHFQIRFTINIARNVKLIAGDTLILSADSCNMVKLLKPSSYSIAWVNTSVGFSKKSLKDMTRIRRPEWTTVKLSAMQADAHGLISNADNKISDLISFEEPGTVLMAVNLNLKTPVNITGAKLAVTKNVKATILNGNDELGDEYTTVYQSTRTTTSVLSLVALIDIEKNEHIQVSVFIPAQTDRWYLLQGSSVSAVLLGNARHRDKVIYEVVINAEPQKWTLIRNCSVANDELMLVESDMYRPQKSLIVYITAFISLLDYKLKSAKFAAMSEKKVLLMSQENLINETATLKLSGVLYVEAGQYIGLYVETNDNVLFHSECRSTAVVMGHPENVIGFAGIVPSDLDINGQLDYSIGSYEVRDNSVTSTYNTEYFDRQAGKFTAQVDGTYVFSANVIVRDLQPVKQEAIGIALYLFINNTPSAYVLKQTFLSANIKSDVFLTRSMSGPLKLKKNDVLTLKIKSSSQKTWIVGKHTSFSCFLLNEGTGHGFIANIAKLSLGSLSKEWFVLSGWATNYTRYFESFSETSPKLASLSEFTAHYTGRHLFTLQVSFKQRVRQKEYDLAVRRNKLDTFICEHETSLFSVFALTCSIVVHCTAGESFDVLLKSDTGLVEQDILDDSEVEKGLLSVMLLPSTPTSFPSASYYLKGHNSFVSTQGILHPWQLQHYSGFLSHCGFTHSTGILRTQSEGWYFTSLVMKYYRSMGNINATYKVQPENHAREMLGRSSITLDGILELHIIGLTYMKAFAELEMIFESTEVGSLPRRGTVFSYAKLPGDPKLSRRYTKQAPTSVTLRQQQNIGGWSVDGSTHNNMLLEVAGVYVVTGNIIVRSTNAVGVRITIDSGTQQLAGTYFTFRDAVFTYLTAGAFLVRSSKSLELRVQANRTVTVLVDSSLSVARLGSLDTSYVMLSTRANTVHYWDEKRTWNAVKHFSEDYMNSFYFDGDLVVPQDAGVYILTVSVPVASETLVTLSLGLFINDILEMRVSKTFHTLDTLVLSKSVYLRQGCYVSVKIQSSTGERFTVIKGSTLSLVLVEKLGSISLEIPTITSQLIEGSRVELGAGMELTLKCRSVGRKDRVYTWYKDGKVLSGHTSPTLRLFSPHSGLYQCKVSLEGVGPLSKPTNVSIIEVNECLDLENCVGDNITCVDTPTSYRCDCLHGLIYYGGQCLEHIPAIVGPGGPASDASFPLWLAIVIPIVCIVCIVCLVFVCVRCARKRNDRGDTTETKALRQNEEEMALKSLQTSQNDISRILEDSADAASTGTTVSFSATNLSSEDEEDIGGFEGYEKLQETTTATTTV